MRKIKAYKILLVALALLSLAGCLHEQMLEAHADFTYEVVDQDFSAPVLVNITNMSTGGETFEWTFEGGQPATSTKFNPGQIGYASGGTYTVKLKISNKDGSVSEMEKKLSFEGSLTADFSHEILINDYAPVTVKLTNLSVDATQFNWQFGGGMPASANQQHSPNVVFETAGEHTISLQTKNAMGDTAQKTVTIIVKPTLAPNFSTAVNQEDEDFQVPVTLKTTNATISATSYVWEAAGASPASSTAENPSFVYSTAGSYELKLTATNGKQTQTITKTITVFADTNLSIQNDVKLGINTAHTSIGCFYSTKEKKVYKKSEVSASSVIDLVFFGLNSGFGTNRFVSPTEAKNFTFDAIPNAQKTDFINKQESCGCSTISSNQFAAMTDDSLLKNLAISNQSVNFTDSVLPRVILFQTQDGRKGAIKIKSFVPDGLNSYIVVDIKVQKQ